MTQRSFSQTLVLAISALIAIPGLLYLSYYIEHLALAGLLSEQNPVLLQLHVMDEHYPVTFAALIAFSFNVSKVMLSAHIAWQYHSGRSLRWGIVTKVLLVCFSAFCTLYLLAEHASTPHAERAYQQKIASTEALASDARDRIVRSTEEQRRMLEMRESRDREMAIATYKPEIQAAKEGMDKERQIGGAASIGNRYRAYERLHTSHQEKRDAALEAIRASYAEQYRALQTQSDERLVEVEERYHEQRTGISRHDTMTTIDARHGGIVKLTALLADVTGGQIRVERVISFFALLLCFTIEILPIVLCGYTFSQLYETAAASTQDVLKVNGTVVSHI